MNFREFKQKREKWNQILSKNMKISTEENAGEVLKVFKEILKTMEKDTVPFFVSTGLYKVAYELGRALGDVYNIKELVNNKDVVCYCWKRIEKKIDKRSTTFKGVKIELNKKNDLTEERTENEKHSSTMEVNKKNDPSEQSYQNNLNNQDTGRQNMEGLTLNTINRIIYSDKKDLHTLTAGYTIIKKKKPGYHVLPIENECQHQKHDGNVPSSNSVTKTKNSSEDYLFNLTDRYKIKKKKKPKRPTFRPDSDAMTVFPKNIDQILPDKNNPENKKSNNNKNELIPETLYTNTNTTSSFNYQQPIIKKKKPKRPNFRPDPETLNAKNQLHKELEIKPDGTERRKPSSPGKMVEDLQKDYNNLTKQTFETKYPKFKNLMTYWVMDKPWDTLAAKGKKLLGLMNNLEKSVPQADILALPLKYDDIDSVFYKKLNNKVQHETIQKIRTSCAPSIHSADNAGSLPSGNTVGTSHVYNYMKYMLESNKNKPKS